MSEMLIRVEMCRSILERINSMAVRLKRSIISASSTKPHKPDLLSPDTRVYDGLREKRENELQQRAEQQAKYQLREEAFVLLEIVPEKFHSPLSRHCFRIVLSIE